MLTLFIRYIGKMLIAYNGFALGSQFLFEVSHSTVTKCSSGLKISVTSSNNLGCDLDHLR